ncbi:hypothetical protein PTKIN_Ptkin01aG0048300 [Pterospermum kingtungense]
MEDDEQIANKPRISKKGGKINCRKCGKSCHNVRTCKGEVGGNNRVNVAAGDVNQRTPNIPKLVQRNKASTARATNQYPRTDQPSNAPAATTVLWMPDGSSQVLSSQQSSVTARNQQPPSVATNTQQPSIKVNQVKGKG